MNLLAEGFVHNQKVSVLPVALHHLHRLRRPPRVRKVRPSEAKARKVYGVNLFRIEFSRSENLKINENFSVSYHFRL